ncbi:uncharacterized protein LOC115224205 isoform X2 [Octopus sinensis]|uniref:Uncharacterized protein LOC115224205 isoform X2 n=1 Tax=Octopus sinensis TaxID=2607531 RepID=A0A7E6FMZ5_9MOLL|nr:uncharacterized protein LOC115224205 isoform X2 [Octopus sinensis]
MYSMSQTTLAEREGRENQTHSRNSSAPFVRTHTLTSGRMASFSENGKFSHLEHRLNNTSQTSTGVENDQSCCTDRKRGTKTTVRHSNFQSELDSVLKARSTPIKKAPQIPALRGNPNNPNSSSTFETIPNSSAGSISSVNRKQSPAHSLSDQPVSFRVAAAPVQTHAPPSPLPPPLDLPPPPNLPRLSGPHPPTRSASLNVKTGQMSNNLNSSPFRQSGRARSSTKGSHTSSILRSGFLDTSDLEDCRTPEISELNFSIGHGTPVASESGSRSIQQPAPSVDSSRFALTSKPTSKIDEPIPVYLKCQTWCNKIPDAGGKKAPVPQPKMSEELRNIESFESAMLDWFQTITQANDTDDLRSETSVSSVGSRKSECRLRSIISNRFQTSDQIENVLTDLLAVSDQYAQLTDSESIGPAALDPLESRYRTFGRKPGSAPRSRMFRRTSGYRSGDMSETESDSERPAHPSSYKTVLSELQAVLRKRKVTPKTPSVESGLGSSENSMKATSETMSPPISRQSKASTPPAPPPKPQMAKVHEANPDSVQTASKTQRRPLVNPGDFQVLLGELSTAWSKRLRRIRKAQVVSQRGGESSLYANFQGFRVPETLASDTSSKYKNFEGVRTPAESIAEEDAEDLKNYESFEARKSKFMANSSSRQYESDQEYTRPSFGRIRGPGMNNDMVRPSRVSVRKQAFQSPNENQSRRKPDLETCSLQSFSVRPISKMQNNVGSAVVSDNEFDDRNEGFRRHRSRHNPEQRRIWQNIEYIQVNSRQTPSRHGSEQSLPQLMTESQGRPRRRERTPQIVENQSSQQPLQHSQSRDDVSCSSLHLSRDVSSKPKVDEQIPSPEDSKEQPKHESSTVLTLSNSNQGPKVKAVSQKTDTKSEFHKRIEQISADDSNRSADPEARKFLVAGVTDVSKQLQSAISEATEKPAPPSMKLSPPVNQNIEPTKAPNTDHMNVGEEKEIILERLQKIGDAKFVSKEELPDLPMDIVKASAMIVKPLVTSNLKKLIGGGKEEEKPKSLGKSEVVLNFSETAVQEQTVLSEYEDNVILGGIEDKLVLEKKPDTSDGFDMDNSRILSEMNVDQKISLEEPSESEPVISEAKVEITSTKTTAITVLQSSVSEETKASDTVLKSEGITEDQQATDGLVEDAEDQVTSSNISISLDHPVIGMENVEESDQETKHKSETVLFLPYTKEPQQNEVSEPQPVTVDSLKSSTVVLSSINTEHSLPSENLLIDSLTYENSKEQTENLEVTPEEASSIEVVPMSQDLPVIQDAKVSSAQIELGQSEDNIEEITNVSVTLSLGGNSDLKKPEESVLKPEESLVIPEESLVIPEESLVIPEESLVKPEESLVKPVESLVKPEESLVKPEESLTKPEESLVKPEELLVKPEESLVIPEESLVKPEESLTKPEESLVKPEESLVIPEESLTKPEESLVKPYEKDEEKESLDVKQISCEQEDNQIEHDQLVEENGLKKSEAEGSKQETSDISEIMDTFDDLQKELRLMESSLEENSAKGPTIESMLQEALVKTYSIDVLSQLNQSDEDSFEPGIICGQWIKKGTTVRSESSVVKEEFRHETQVIDFGEELVNAGDLADSVSEQLDSGEGELKTENLGFVEHEEFDYVQKIPSDFIEDEIYDNVPSVTEGSIPFVSAESKSPDALLTKEEEEHAEKMIPSNIMSMETVTSSRTSFVLEETSVPAVLEFEASISGPTNLETSAQATAGLEPTYTLTPLEQDSCIVEPAPMVTHRGMEPPTEVSTRLESYMESSADLESHIQTSIDLESCTETSVEFDSPSVELSEKQQAPIDASAELERLRMALAQMEPSSVIPPQMEPSSEAQSQLEALRMALAQMEPSSATPPQLESPSAVPPQLEPSSEAQSQLEALRMALAQMEPVNATPQQPEPSNVTLPQLVPSATAQSQLEKLSMALSQMESSPAALPRLEPSAVAQSQLDKLSLALSQMGSSSVASSQLEPRTVALSELESSIEAVPTELQLCTMQVTEVESSTTGTVGVFTLKEQQQIPEMEKSLPLTDEVVTEAALLVDASNSEPLEIPVEIHAEVSVADEQLVPDLELTETQPVSATPLHKLPQESTDNDPLCSSEVTVTNQAVLDERLTPCYPETRDVQNVAEQLVPEVATHQAEKFPLFTIETAQPSYEPADFVAPSEILIGEAESETQEVSKALEEPEISNLAANAQEGVANDFSFETKHVTDESNYLERIDIISRDLHNLMPVTKVDIAEELTGNLSDSSDEIFQDTLCDNSPMFRRKYTEIVRAEIGTRMETLHTYQRDLLLEIEEDDDEEFVEAEGEAMCWESLKESWNIQGTLETQTTVEKCDDDDDRSLPTIYEATEDRTEAVVSKTVDVFEGLESAANQCVENLEKTSTELALAEADEISIYYGAEVTDSAECKEEHDVLDNAVMVEGDKELVEALPSCEEHDVLDNAVVVGDDKELVEALPSCEEIEDESKTVQLNEMKRSEAITDFGKISEKETVTVKEFEEFSGELSSETPLMKSDESFGNLVQYLESDSINDLEEFERIELACEELSKNKLVDLQDMSNKDECVEKTEKPHKANGLEESSDSDTMKSQQIILTKELEVDEGDESADLMVDASDAINRVKTKVSEQISVSLLQNNEEIEVEDQIDYYDYMRLRSCEEEQVHAALHSEGGLSENGEINNKDGKVEHGREVAQKISVVTSEQNVEIAASAAPGDASFADYCSEDVSENITRSVCIDNVTRSVCVDNVDVVKDIRMESYSKDSENGEVLKIDALNSTNLSINANEISITTTTEANSIEESIRAENGLSEKTGFVTSEENSTEMELLEISAKQETSLLDDSSNLSGETVKDNQCDMVVDISVINSEVKEEQKVPCPVDLSGVETQTLVINENMVLELPEIDADLNVSSEQSSPESSSSVSISQTADKEFQQDQLEDLKDNTSELSQIQENSETTAVATTKKKRRRKAKKNKNNKDKHETLLTEDQEVLENGDAIEQDEMTEEYSGECLLIEDSVEELSVQKVCYSQSSTEVHSTVATAGAEFTESLTLESDESVEHSRHSPVEVSATFSLSDIVKDISKNEEEITEENTSREQHQANQDKVTETTLEQIANQNDTENHEQTVETISQQQTQITSHDTITEVTLLQQSGQDETSQQLTIQDETSQQLTIQDGTSQQLTIQDETSQQLTIQDGTSQQLTNQDETSQQLTIQDEASQQLTIQDETSQQLTNQDETSQQLTNQDEVTEMATQKRVSHTVTETISQELTNHELTTSEQLASRNEVIETDSQQLQQLINHDETMQTVSLDSAAVLRDEGISQTESSSSVVEGKKQKTVTFGTTETVQNIDNRSLQKGYEEATEYDSNSLLDTSHCFTIYFRENSGDIPKSKLPSLSASRGQNSLQPLAEESSKQIQNRIDINNKLNSRFPSKIPRPFSKTNTSLTQSSSSSFSDSYMKKSNFLSDLPDSSIDDYFPRREESKVNSTDVIKPEMPPPSSHFTISNQMESSEGPPPVPLPFRMLYDESEPPPIPSRELRSLETEPENLPTNSIDTTVPPGGQDGVTLVREEQQQDNTANNSGNSDNGVQSSNKSAIYQQKRFRDLKHFSRISNLTYNEVLELEEHEKVEYLKDSSTEQRMQDLRDFSQLCSTESVFSRKSGSSDSGIQTNLRESKHSSSSLSLQASRTSGSGYRKTKRLSDSAVCVDGTEEFDQSMSTSIRQTNGETERSNTLQSVGRQSREPIVYGRINKSREMARSCYSLDYQFRYGSKGSSDLATTADRSSYHGSSRNDSETNLTVQRLQDAGMCTSNFTPVKKNFDDSQSFMSTVSFLKSNEDSNLSVNDTETESIYEDVSLYSSSECDTASIKREKKSKKLSSRLKKFGSKLKFWK